MSIFIDQSTVVTGNVYLPLLCTISNYLPTNNTAINLLTTSISTSSLSKSNNLFTAATNNLLATVLSDLSTPTNSNTTPKLSYYDIRKPKT
ncbi:hypothetical protein G9A89_003155 [Geosiphon pyriformis]|nr:hypothetical protein G9A89_003155 [Geosiphon pyriformis]